MSLDGVSSCLNSLVTRNDANCGKKCLYADTLNVHWSEMHSSKKSIKWSGHFLYAFTFPDNPFLKKMSILSSGGQHLLKVFKLINRLNSWRENEGNHYREESLENVVLIIIKFDELLLLISPRIINGLRNYIKHSVSSDFQKPQRWFKKLGCTSGFFQLTSRSWWVIS